jgi:fructokinase
VAGTLGKALGMHVGFDTDVNAAALAEHRLGSGRGRDPLVYLTVGTGIGGGAIVNGHILHGASHPKMGHILMARRDDDPFRGFCPFHGSCWEGLASGPAVEARWGVRGEDLPPEHSGWDLEAWYLAQGIVDLFMILSPQAVNLGGGIAQVPGLLGKVRTRAASLCAGYLDRPRTPEEWSDVIRAPGLRIPGHTGAFLLAENAGE